jgi:hypothetical protein
LPNACLNDWKRVVYTASTAVRSIAAGAGATGVRVRALAPEARRARKATAEIISVLRECVGEKKILK